MIQTRNAEIEEREREKENLKAILYIPSAIRTQMNLVSFCLGADLAKEAALKICAIMLQYSNCDLRAFFS